MRFLHNFALFEYYQTVKTLQCLGAYILLMQAPQSCIVHFSNLWRLLYATLVIVALLYVTLRYCVFSRPVHTSRLNPTLRWEKQEKKNRFFNQSLSSNTQKDLSSIPDSAMFGGRFAGAIATSASPLFELDNASMCCDTMMFVFLMYTSKQSLSQRRRSLIYQPFMPASASSTQAFTLIE